MARASRVKKTLLNVRANLLCYFASLIVAFFTRKVLLDSLGAEFIGLTGTIASLLSFLNMAELGLGTAVGYVLYKPLFNQDWQKINEIVSVFGYLYRWIGRIILAFGIVLSLFLPCIFNETEIPMYVIYIGFYAGLASALIGYFINYNQSVMWSDQRSYIVTGYYQASITIKVIVQMLCAMYICSFVLYFAIELTFGIIYCFILQWKIHKTYPWMHPNVHNGKTLLKKYSEIGTYTKQIFVHRISYFIQINLSTILIYAYVSLPMVALYGNYQIITGRISSLVSATLGSTWGSVGNLIAEGNKEKPYAIYCELLALQMCMGGFTTLCIYMLIDGFVFTWLGEEYVLSKAVLVLICLQFILNIFRSVTDQYIEGYGLFYDTWAPIVESLLFVAFSIVFGSLYGLLGVLAGPIVSTILITYVWRPFFLFNKGFHNPVIYYWAKFIRNIAAIAIAAVVTHVIYMPILRSLHISDGWLHWIVQAVIYSVLISIFLFVSFYSLVPEFRRLALKFIRNRKHII